VSAVRPNATQSRAICSNPAASSGSAANSADASAVLAFIRHWSPVIIGRDPAPEMAESRQANRSKAQRSCSAGPLGCVGASTPVARPFAVSSRDSVVGPWGLETGAWGGHQQSPWGDPHEDLAVGQGHRRGRLVQRRLHHPGPVRNRRARSRSARRQAGTAALPSFSEERSRGGSCCSMAAGRGGRPGVHGRTRHGDRPQSGQEAHPRPMGGGAPGQGNGVVVLGSRIPVPGHPRVRGVTVPAEPLIA